MDLSKSVTLARLVPSLQLLFLWIARYWYSSVTWSSLFLLHDEDNRGCVGFFSCWGRTVLWMCSWNMQHLGWCDFSLFALAHLQIQGS